MLSAMPGPPVLPLPMPVQTLLWYKRPTELMRWCRARYGKSFVLKLPAFTPMVTCDIEAIRTIFAARPDEMHAGRFNRILRPVVGDSSVLLLDAAPHMRRRKLLLPAFHGERMRFYGRTMAEITRRVADAWPENEPFPLHRSTQEITLEVILRTVFGAEEGAQLTALRINMTRLFGRAGRLGAFPAMLYLSQHPERENSLPFRWLLGGRDTVDGMLYRQIAARRAEHAEHTRADVLSMLLGARDENGEALDDASIRDELMTSLAAGHETTATALAWAVERMLMHPHVYRRLCDEVRGLGDEPDPERIQDLPYLDATVKEVLRLRPIIPVVGRYLCRPYQLAGYDLPTGSTVAACIYLAHRDPDIYPEPEAFRPERFLGVTPDPAAWLPFGGGIRRCIGFAFAMYEMKIVLATMLAHSEFELATPGPLKVVRRAVTFWPEGGTRVRVRRAA